MYLKSIAQTKALLSANSQNLQDKSGAGEYYQDFAYKVILKFFWLALEPKAYFPT